MLSAALRRAHHRSHLPPPHQASCFSPLNLISTSDHASCAGEGFHPIDQFLPPRTLPRPSIRPHLLREIILSLAYLLKTSPGCLADLKALALDGLRPAPLARLLHSFPHHRTALAFFAAAIPDLSAATVSCCCDAAHLLVSTGDPALTILAQHLLADLLGRVEPRRGAELIYWTYRHQFLRSNYSALHLVLRSFLNAGMASEALDVVERIRSLGKTPSLTALAILLRLLFRRGDSSKAWKLFKDMVGRGPRPSSMTCNAMILGSCLKGHVRVGEGILQLMPRLQCESDACSYNILMKAHCVYGQSSCAFELFDVMLSSGCAPSVVTYNILIDALGHEGRMEEARKLFEDMEKEGIQSNTITYNILIDGYVKAGQIDKANLLYRQMKEKGYMPDCYTFNILVSGYYKFRRDWEREGELLFDDLLKPESCSHGAMLDVFLSRACWDGRLDDARELLVSAIEQGLEVSAAGFNSVIASFSKEGFEEEAFHLYQTMMDVGLSPSASTCNSLLIGLCSRGRLQNARELIDKMVERGFHVNVSAFTIYIDACFRLGDPQGAMRCWNELENQGIQVDVIGFSAYINGLCRANCIDEAVEAFQEMSSRGLFPNNFTYNSLISGLCRVGNVAEALKLEREMRQNGLIPDIFTRNIIIDGFCRQGRMKIAHSVLMDMYTNGLEPDVTTYNTFINAYCRAFDMDNAVSFSKKISSDGLKPDIFTYNIWIHSFCSRLMMNQTMKTLDELILTGLIPNTTTYNTLMNGICYDVLDRAMILTGKLLKMAFVPNVVTVNLLLSHFCKQGLAWRALMWGERLTEVSFTFDDATRNILERAYRDVKDGAEIPTESGKGLFLEHLMHVTYQLLHKIRHQECRPLMITSLFHDGINRTSKMADVR
ncbi:pentatricopeptide repeat-containing protein [Canna indica]|uniref:Pentatricopeptide repeat-containing protein n=1 Tax=Canna indica TaxID=4628 RepID=A0AAQ3QE88_9LILI|nr:pentatricopeptide repeat-containing protein [Canna indica]